MNYAHFSKMAKQINEKTIEFECKNVLLKRNFEYLKYHY